MQSTEKSGTPGFDDILRFSAALDPVAEAEIYTKFNEIAGDKTAIYISHRLSSCKFCDEIAVFDHGEVVQQGTHEELLRTCDEYRSIYESQTKNQAQPEELK